MKNEEIVRRGYDAISEFETDEEFGEPVSFQSIHGRKPVVSRIG